MKNLERFPPAGPLWERSKPHIEFVDGVECVSMDAMNLAESAQWYLFNGVPPYDKPKKSAPRKPTTSRRSRK